QVALAMAGYAIPRVAVQVTLLLTDGERRPGEIYVMERVPHHSGHETPLEMLNRPEEFFPFRPVGEGPVLLVTNAHTIILSVATDDTAQDPARLSAAKLVAVELTPLVASAMRACGRPDCADEPSRLADEQHDDRRLLAR